MAGTARPSARRTRSGSPRHATPAGTRAQGPRRGPSDDASGDRPSLTGSPLRSGGTWVVGMARAPSPPGSERGRRGAGGGSARGRAGSARGGTWRGSSVGRMGAARPVGGARALWCRGRGPLGGNPVE
ncbi:MAG: hypothetical protein AVDCRST_MAG49-582 [uncultured Thermomicrobiales bacterium]|uniref:Uncharacterized protein n=1 Tax=uncultured Thermomicrobiales bacterium TaxID=1645740 RepID=A0A6J4U2H0_9BACT|nr:MAG: hypothetical protein AVDCRST_MAG49-582 [uncultured Thermomicrobiales bacterium]